jgi:hypothetical protein
MDQDRSACDAERLMTPFIDVVQASPIRIAPERKDDFLALFGGQVPYVDFTNTTPPPTSRPMSANRRSRSVFRLS